MDIAGPRPEARGKRPYSEEDARMAPMSRPQRPAVMAGGQPPSGRAGGPGSGAREPGGRGPTTIDGIKVVGQRIWDKISSQNLYKLFTSKPRRMRAVIDANGGLTKY